MLVSCLMPAFYSIPMLLQSGRYEGSPLRVPGAGTRAAQGHRLCGGVLHRPLTIRVSMAAAVLDLTLWSHILNGSLAWCACGPTPLTTYRLPYPVSSLVNHSSISLSVMADFEVSIIGRALILCVMPRALTNVDHVHVLALANSMSRHHHGQQFPRAGRSQSIALHRMQSAQAQNQCER